MAIDEDPKEFPDVSQKLAAPKKLSAFEKERQAQEAKRQREEAETAAALKEFKDAFEDEDDEDDQSRSSQRPPSGPRGSSSGFANFGLSGRYNAPPTKPRGGMVSHGLMPGPPPPSLKRRRALDEMREAQQAREEEEMPHRDFGRSESGRRDRDEEIEDTTPKPTIHLSSLPPGTTNEKVKDLLGERLGVHSIRFLPPAGPGSSGKKSMAAIATLASDTPSTEIDGVVNALKNEYLGCGFYLSISRHLSSIAINPSIPGAPSATYHEPFGASKTRDFPARPSMRNAPPPPERARFDLYDSHSRSMPPIHSIVDVQIPLDLSVVRAIHIIADRLLSEPDPDHAQQIEALLMGIPEVQQDEKLSFLFDSRSVPGVYYRYLLWRNEVNSVAHNKRSLDRNDERVYADKMINWSNAGVKVPFPDMNHLGDVKENPDYNSSDEDNDDEGAIRRFNDGSRETASSIEAKERKHLSPLQSAKFAWLLSRVPKTIAKLRTGDVAAVSNFAIANARLGAEEIVRLLLLNVERPFSSTECAKEEDYDMDSDENDIYEPDEELPIVVTAPVTDDPSNAKLIALYLISDMLSASTTAGANNAWKYRQMFEAAFTIKKTFEQLGKLGEELGWGRMKNEQWKRKIRVLFDSWEQKSIFSKDYFETFKKNFFRQQPNVDMDVEMTGAGRSLDGATDDVEEEGLSRFESNNGHAPPTSTRPAHHRQNDSEDEDMDEENSNNGGDKMMRVGSAQTARHFHPETSAPVARAEDSLEHNSVVTPPNEPKSGSGANGGASKTKIGFSMSAVPTGVGTSVADSTRKPKADDMFADSDEE